MSIIRRGPIGALYKLYRDCPYFPTNNLEIQVPRANIETPSDPIFSAQNAAEIEGSNNDAHGEEIEVFAEDEVIDVIGVDEGLVHEVQSNENASNANFEKAS